MFKSLFQAHLKEATKYTTIINYTRSILEKAKEGSLTGAELDASLAKLHQQIEDCELTSTSIGGTDANPVSYVVPDLRARAWDKVTGNLARGEKFIKGVIDEVNKAMFATKYQYLPWNKLPDVIHALRENNIDPKDYTLIGNILFVTTPDTDKIAAIAAIVKGASKGVF